MEPTAYDGRDIRNFINENFRVDSCEYVDVDDPDELREALETDDRVTIAKYTKRYPKLWVF